MAWRIAAILLSYWPAVSAEGPTSLPFDCNADYIDCYHCMEKRWSVAKRNWCCTHASRGCSTTASPATQPATLPATTSLPFDCNADFINCYHCMEKRWSVAKRAWCCTHASRGCTTTAPPAPPAPPATTSLPFDCNADFINCYHCMEKRWSVAKRAWCCTHASRGCSTTALPAPPVTTPCPTTSLPFDCNADFINCYHCMEKRWSVAKRAWCCTHASRGCSTTAPPAPPVSTPPPTTSLPFDCNADFVDCYHCLEKKWSVAKRSWCCAHARRGCTTTAPPAPEPPPPTTSLPFDCNADFVDCYHCLEKKWSVAKRAWCCDHGGRGCTTTAPPATTQPPTTSLPFDCNADYVNCYHCLEKKWSVAKRNWCCEHGGRGCITTAPPPATTVPPPATTAPPLPTTSPHFDCNAGWNNWQLGWSDEKKQWCCGTVSKGCPDQSTSPCPPMDCSVAFNNWQAAWGPQKKLYCCQHENKGCPPPPPAPNPPPPGPTNCPPLDCNVAWGNWQKAWSVQKKQYCCQHENKGCPPAPPVPQPPTPCPPMDCNVAFNNWQAAWGPQKKLYCCQHENKGCPPGTSPPVTAAPIVPAPSPSATTACPPIDCNVAFNNWKAAWGATKKAYCCTHEGKGCTGAVQPFSGVVQSYEQPQQTSGYMQALPASGTTLVSGMVGASTLAAAALMVFRRQRRTFEADFEPMNVELMAVD